MVFFPQTLIKMYGKLTCTFTASEKSMKCRWIYTIHGSYMGPFVVAQCCHETIFKAHHISHCIHVHVGLKTYTDHVCNGHKTSTKRTISMNLLETEFSLFHFVDWKMMQRRQHKWFDLKIWLGSASVVDSGTSGIINMIGRGSSQSSTPKCPHSSRFDKHTKWRVIK